MIGVTRIVQKSRDVCDEEKKCSLVFLFVLFCLFVVFFYVVNA